jgi:hypothetical protein
VKSRWDSALSIAVTTASTPFASARAASSPTIFPPPTATPTPLTNARTTVAADLSAHAPRDPEPTPRAHAGAERKRSTRSVETLRAALDDDVLPFLVGPDPTETP